MAGVYKKKRKITRLSHFEAIVERIRNGGNIMMLFCTVDMGFTSTFTVPFSFFDLQTLQSLCPDYKILTKENTDFYKSWEKENKKNGIAKSAFSIKHGCNFTSRVTTELHRLEKQQEQTIEKNLKAFIEKYKNDIYKAQCEAIKKSNELSDKKIKEKYDKLKAEWENKPEIKQLVKGFDIAISTLNTSDREEKLDYINKCLRLGYKVKCATASTVFLTWEKEEKPCCDDIYKEFPYSTKTSLSQQYYVEHERIHGVVIPHYLKLIGYEYPKYKYESIATLF